jgi:hypothetical protein
MGEAQMLTFAGGVLIAAAVIFVAGVVLNLIKEYDQYRY